MKFLALLPILASLAVPQDVYMEDSSLTYIPNLQHLDKTFMLRVTQDEVSRAVLNSLDSNQRGQMDKLINEITAIGAKAENLAARYAQQDSAVRKNALNHLRAEVAYKVRQWCQPRNNWFCTRKVRDEALNFITTRFCAVYTKEMREETCYPEANNDFNRARLTVNP